MVYADELAQLQRKRQLAQALIQQGAQPQGMQAGRTFVGPTPISGLASLAGIVAGGVMDRRLEKKEKGLNEQRRKQLADMLSGITGTQAPSLAPPVGAGMPQGSTPAGMPPESGAIPASVPTSAPSPGQPAADPQRASMLQFLQGLPIEQQEALVGQQAMARLFPKPKTLKEVDLGDKIGFADEAGNIVKTQPKGATPQGLTDDQREYEAAVKAGTFKGSLQDWILQSKRAGASQVNVNTEKNLYGTMADAQGKANVELYGQAQKAPDLIQRAQRVKAALGPGSQVITGAGAEQLLGLSKIAAQFGFNTGDAAADTEGLSRELASATLDNIRSSGLGGGSGFSNADRDFLEKAVGGKITLEAKTLQRLADLNEKSALATIQKWNATASRLKPEQLQSLGMAKIEMPDGMPAPGKAPKLTKNPDGSYTYSP